MKPDIVASQYIEAFLYSIDQQRGDFERLMLLQDSYDAQINSAIWPTQSEIPTAQQFTMVEEQLGPARDALFPESNGVQLIPTEDGIDEERIRNAEWSLWTMLNYTMKLKKDSLRSIKDCYKCGLGYGIVEPFVTTPSSSAEIVSGKRKTRVMVNGKAQISIRYRYVSPGRVVPDCDGGVDFNGSDAASVVYFMDFYPEWQLRAMYKKGNPYTNENMKGDIDKIVEMARTFQTGGFSGYKDILQSLSGREMFRGVAKPTRASAKIPVLKVYEKPGKETWIALHQGKSGQVMYEKDYDLHEMRTPLVKWTAWPDADRWFPMSMPEAEQKRGFAYDLWLNFWYDMMTKTKDTHFAYDKSALPPGQRELYAGQDIAFEHGDARSAAGWVDGPRVDQSIAAMGDVLDGNRSRITGKQDYTQKNFTRGGAGAFNDLMNNMQGRERLSSIILETGGLTDTYEHVFAFMQETVGDGINLVRPTWDADSQKTIADRRLITQDDLVHGYALNIDTSERRMLGGMNFEERMRVHEALQDRDDVRPQEVNRYFPIPETGVKRVFKSKKEQEALQESRMNREALAQLSGAQQGNQQQPQPQEILP